MTYVDFDLSTAELFYGTVYADGVIGRADAVDSVFSFPGLELDPATTYQFQADIAVPADRLGSVRLAFWLYSQGAQGPDSSNWSTFAGITLPDSGTYTVAVGPSDSPGWATAVADQEMLVTFQVTAGYSVTGLRYQAGLSVAPYSTDTSYTNDGYSYSGAADVIYTAPLAALPPGLERRDVRRVHQSLPTPTLVKGRPQ